MDIVEEMIGTIRRRGMRIEDRGVRTEEEEAMMGARAERQMTVAGMSRAREAYRKVEVKVEAESGPRSMWVECRECEHRERVPSMNRGELVRAIDAGELRCGECGGRMVEG